MARMTWKVVSCFILLLVLALPGYVQAQSNITYVYDDLGRLVGVIDAGGNAAIYKYDAVGNLLSITRYSSTQLSIIGFTPTTGPVGTTVTINGTGFSATPSQNTVKFNGTTASVSSATVNQIVTTVPTGATTGLISVTVGGLTATSDTPFTLRDPIGAPTITGFTPTRGIPRAGVTITGTNFDTNIANDKTRFNVTLVPASSATPTTIAASVPPGGTSGHISVTTPAGKAVSSADFIVSPPVPPPSPPPGYSDPYIDPTLIDFNGHTTAPPVDTVISVNTIHHIALLLFDGTQGRRASFNFTEKAIGSWTDVYIFAPDGAALAALAGSSTITGSGAFVDPRVLPATGTYSVVVRPVNDATGTIRLRAYDVPPDLTLPIPADGSPTRVDLDVPGQNANLTFSGTQNQRVSLVLNKTITDWTWVRIIKPNGTILASTLLTDSTGFIDTTILPDSGIYTIQVDPRFAGTGSMDLRLYTVPADLMGDCTTIPPNPYCLTINGAQLLVNIATPGQNAVLTFSNDTDGRLVTVLAQWDRPRSMCIGMQLLYPAPDDREIAGGSWCDPPLSFGLPQRTLARGTNYRIKIDPWGALTGAVWIWVTSP